MAKIYYAKDCRFEKIKNMKIAVIGYGSQGHAHALNLQESGADVVVGLYEGSKSWKLAEDAGLRVRTTEEAVRNADIVMILLPDEKQPEIWAKSIAPNLKEKVYVGFGHGFNIHFGQILPSADINVFMAAPKGPGHMVRRTFVAGSGVPTLIAIHADPSGDTREIALAWAAGIGGARSGVNHRTTQYMAIGFHATIHLRQGTTRKLETHAKKCHHPHPQYCPWTTGTNRHGDASDIA